MKKILLTLGMALAMTGVVSAAPLCSTFLGQPVVNINATGCSINHLVFSDFQVINNGGFAITNVNVATFVGLNANNQNSEFHFAVNTTPGVAGPAGGDIILQYSVTGGNQVGAGLRIGTANNVTITEVICNAAFTGTICVAPPAQSFSTVVNSPAPPGTTVNSVQFGSPLNKVWVQKDIAFGNNGSISDFINSHQTVPEPTTSLLMGTALLGLALLRKRYGKK